MDPLNRSRRQLMTLCKDLLSFKTTKEINGLAKMYKIQGDKKTKITRIARKQINAHLKGWWEFYMNKKLDSQQ
jgi:hypothetical protein